MTLPDVASAHATAEQVARRSYGRLLAVLAARSGDIESAEDSLADAFAAALEKWPTEGVPANPEGWLLTVARRRSIDGARRAQTGERYADSVRALGEQATALEDTQPIPDERLAMLFACAHPGIESSAHAPLMLQVVLGLDARAIAAAFLTSPAAMSKRLVRAKARIREAGVALQVPQPEDLEALLVPVLDAIYAAFTEGWGDAGGVDHRRRDLALEAIFLGQLVTQLVPASAEAEGLLALMLYAEARSAARQVGGEFISFDSQEQARWNWPMIQQANTHLVRAGTPGVPGRYQLEAAIQSAHLLRRAAGIDNWQEILALYGGLFQVTGSPVVLVNRALAVLQVEGPEAARAELDAIGSDSRLPGYQPWWVARAEVLGRLGQFEEAARCWEIALGLENDPAVRRFLAGRMRAGRAGQKSAPGKDLTTPA